MEPTQHPSQPGQNYEPHVFQPAPEHHAPVASPAAPPAPVLQADSPVAPVPVVQVLSPRGVEYVFLTINLFTAAVGLISVLLALVNGRTDFSVLVFPVTLLVVAVPLFALFFLRLKKAELQDPNLKLDASKRRSTQVTQVVAYLTSFIALITFVGTLFASVAGEYKGSVGKVALNALVFLVVAGGILAYYWWDEHKVR
jgi:hypothetical protein